MIHSLPLDQPTPEPSHLTNAYMILERAGQPGAPELRYDIDALSWLFWNGRVWEHETGDSKISALMESVAADWQRQCRVLRDAIHDAPKPDRPPLIQRLKLLSSWAIACQSDHCFRATFNRYRALPGVSVSTQQLDSHRNVFAVKNGYIVLSKHPPYVKLTPPDQHLLITKFAPVEYVDPTPATVGGPTPGAATPAVGAAAAAASFFHSWLAEVQPDPDVRAYLARVTGYCLVGGNSEQLFAVLYGPPKSGKSTFLEALAAMLGPYATHADARIFDSGKMHGAELAYHLASYRGARLLISSELDGDGQLRSSFVKNLTGNEEVVARHPAGRPFRYKPEYKPFIATNHKPNIPDGDEGVFRRLKVIAFHLSIPNPDPAVAARLKRDPESILSWALQGFVDYATLGGLKAPQSILADTRLYQADQDSVQNWLDDCCDIHPSYKTPTAELYASYEAWATKMGLGRFSAKRLSQRLEEKGFDAFRDAKTRFRVGIAISTMFAKTSQNGRNSPDF